MKHWNKILPSDMRYFILPLTYAICLHYMLEAAKMVSTKQLSASDSHWIWVLAIAAAVTVTLGHVFTYLDWWCNDRHEGKEHP